MIRKPCSQRIHRLQAVLFFFVLFTGIKDLRMLHGQHLPAAHHTSPESHLSAAGKRIPQKRHPKPDHLQSSGQVLYRHGSHLQFPASRHLHSSVDHARHCLHLSLFQTANGHRIFIYVISSGIIPDQIPDCRNPKLTKQPAGLFSDPL